MAPENKECTQKECPQCHALIPVHPEYTAWCKQCGWNLNPRPQRKKPHNVFESFYISLGRKQSKTLFEEFKNVAMVKPKLSFARVLAFIISLIVHGITLSFLILGIYLISLWMNFIITGLGLVCILAAIFLRPHLVKRPKKSITRQEYPALFQLVEKVSRALGVSPNFDIVINEEFNARFSQVGWRRRNLFYIGLPLWSVLDDREKVALMAHEVAHKVNGDASRGFLMHTAILALNNWYDLLNPKTIWDPTADYRLRIAVAFANVLKLLVAKIPKFLAYLLSHLVWRDSQRSEYLADYLAADLTGTEPVTGLLDKLHIYDEFVFTIQKITLNPDLKLDFFNEFKNRVVHMPQSELERIRRVQEIEQATLDTTHPPTVFRIKMLEAHPISSPSISFGDFPFAQIEHELQKWKMPIQEKLIDLYKDYLYY